MTNLTQTHANSDIQKTTADSQKPTFTPSPQEYKDGYFKDGIFHCPRYAIAKNGEVLESLGMDFAYPYEQAYHILMHLQAVSSDDFTLQPIAYKAMTDYTVIDSDNPFHPVNNKGGE